MPRINRRQHIEAMLAAVSDIERAMAELQNVVPGSTIAASLDYARQRLEVIKSEAQALYQEENAKHKTG